MVMTHIENERILRYSRMALLFTACALVSGATLAQDVNACEKVSGFFGNLLIILKVISAGIVTVAIVFAGYQIAFAHKRLSDVAPVLIGGLLIGGAATIATWFVDGFDDDAACTDFQLGQYDETNFDSSVIVVSRTV